MIYGLYSERRSFIFGAIAAISVAGSAASPSSKTAGMYGLIGRMSAQPGQREALVAILIKGVAGMPGCLSYIVANDPADVNMIWITEVWEGKDAHAASLTLPSVRDAIARGRPLIASMETVSETLPVGGFGLTKATS